MNKVKLARSNNWGFSTLEVLIGLAVITVAMSSALVILMGSRALVAQGIDNRSKAGLNLNSCYMEPGQWPKYKLSGLGYALPAIADIKVRNRILYVALSSTPDKNQPTFLIFSLASSTNPVLLGSLDNSTSTASGINSLVIFDHYAYLASARAISSATNFGQLQIVDISIPQSPQLVVSYKIPQVTGTSGQGVGNSIFYSNGFVFLGLTKTGNGAEFNVIDVKDALYPHLVGSFGFSDSINAILVKDSYAYVAHPAGSGSLYPEQLTVLNISTSANIFRAGGYKAIDSQGNGKSLYVADSSIYLGRTITNTINPELIELNQNNQLVKGVKINSSVNSLKVIGELLFVLTGGELKAFNLAGLTEVLPSLPLEKTGTSLACLGNVIYVALADSGSGKLLILTPGD